MSQPADAPKFLPFGAEPKAPGSVPAPAPHADGGYGWFGPQDMYLFNEGSHLRLYDKLGAHAATIDGVEGYHFAVWAPNASRVAIVGDFNQWDGRMHPLRLRRECGVWEIFLPGLRAGALENECYSDATCWRSD